MRPTETSDLYERLQIEKDSSLDDIKSAYRKNAMQWHPDRNEDKELSKLEFIALTEAYEVLSDEKEKNFYDSTGMFKSFRTRYETKKTENTKEQYQAKNKAKDEIFDFAWKIFEDASKDSIMGKYLDALPEVKMMARMFMGDEFYDMFKDKYIK